MIINKYKHHTARINRITNQIFTDKDLQNTTLNQGFKLLIGPLLIILLPFFLSREVQGYWFSFISISALSVLADLGFTIIILQFSAHEFAYLKILNNYFVAQEDRDNEHLFKLASLLHFSVKWLTKLLFFAFVPILIIGFFFFNTGDSNLNWKLPWILYTIGAIFSFANNVLLSFIEGCNFVSSTQRIRFYSTLFNFTLLFPLLIIGADLYALAISLLLSSILTTLITYIKFKKLLNQLWRIAREKQYNWFKEFFVFFRKYAISVASGYVVVQLFTPLSFKFYGPIEAGQVGLTMSLCTAIFSISNIWFQSIAPKVNILNSRKKWIHIGKLIKKRLALSLITYFIVFAVFSILYIILYNSGYKAITNRFLPFIGIFTLVIHWLLQLPGYAMAFYLRSFKKEPFMVLSIASSILIVLLTSYIVFNFSVKFIFTGLLITSIIFLPINIIIFVKKKRIWQSIY